MFKTTRSYIYWILIAYGNNLCHITSEFGTIKIIMANLTLLYNDNKDLVTSTLKWTTVEEVVHSWSQFQRSTLKQQVPFNWMPESIVMSEILAQNSQRADTILLIFSWTVCWIFFIMSQYSVIKSVIKSPRSYVSIQ